MIGFYNYTVVLTYVSLVCSVFGMTQAVGGHYRTAIVCLALSGLMDMFDGKIARTKKDRTDDEKLFGVQIDSLCDVVCFGVFPALLGWVLGIHGILGTVAICYYCVCSVIRLGFFNVLETNRQRVEEGANKYYRGLPITTMAIVLPITFLLNFYISEQVFHYILLVMFLLVGTLFVVNFKLRKPSNAVLVVLVLVVAVAVVAILLFSRYHITFPFMKNQDPIICYLLK